MVTRDFSIITILNGVWFLWPKHHLHEDVCAVIVLKVFICFHDCWACGVDFMTSSTKADILFVLKSTNKVTHMPDVTLP